MRKHPLNLTLIAFVAGLFSIASEAVQGHGPQLQITSDNGKIMTREIFMDGPYEAVSSPTQVYVMPLGDFNGVVYSRPNGELDAITLLPAFPSGPGLAYGSDLADGGPQAFAAGSVLSVNFADGLKSWNGAAFADAGTTQLKAFRGSDPLIASPLENYAVSSDSGPFDSLSLSTVGDGYGAEGAEVHGSLRFAMLGDGTSPTAEVPDGVFLATFQISSTQTDLAASDPYYFVLHQGMSSDVVNAAVGSLGISADRIQVVPEPAGFVLSLLGLAGLLARARRS